MNEEERESEEVDVEPYEGEPDFEDSPTTQTNGASQDIVEHAEEEPDA